MKKYSTLLLLCAALLTACSSAETNETDAVTATETEASVETVADTDPIEEEEILPTYQLALASEPVFEDGTLLLYFTEDDIWLQENTSYRIGLRGNGEAYTIRATSVTNLYPDMMNGDEYRGIALTPAEEIPAGDYRVSVTFAEYYCDFELTIQ